MPKTFSANDFEVKPSTIPAAGRGLFARVPIELEDTIGYYAGEVITSDELVAGKFSGSDYILWVTRNHLIVGEGEKSNYTRYINHGEEPNAYLVVSSRWKTARFECVKPIAAGDEIFFNYGEEFWGGL